MKTNIQSYQIGSARKRGEGLRIGTVRYLPRGVKKEDYASKDYFDVWLPTVAPSRELMGWYKKGELSKERWQLFAKRYKTEMQKTDSRQVIKLLAEVSKKIPISIGCYCGDENRCHRSILLELIRNAVRT
jgi:uncharacterized protein YeaO (DUF488 family)